MKSLKLLIYFLSVVITAALMFSCSDSQPFGHELGLDDVEKIPDFLTETEQIALSVQKKGTYEISESEALEIFKNFVSAKSDGQGVCVKSAIDSDAGIANVKSVVLKTSKKTGKPLYFEFVLNNVDGTSGFALVAADERTNGVLAFSEIGSISDTTFNKSLKFALGLVDIYAEEQTNDELDIEALVLSAHQKLHDFSHQNEESLLKVKPPPHPPSCSCTACGGPGYDCGTYYGSYGSVFTNDILKQIPGGWHQKYPYNSLLPYIDNVSTNNRAFVGCGSIAVSQIMSYHKKPYYSNGGLLISQNDWNTIVSNSSPGSVSLLQLLLKEMFESLTISYDKYGTSSTMTTALGFINDQSRHNFTSGTAITYSFQGVKNALNYGPTYMEGTEANGDNGHAWVVDGARTVTTMDYRVFEFCNIIDSSVSVEYIRCDWGWNTSSNTWFKSNVFVVSGYNFNSNLRIISSIQ